jgi:predicted RNA-binding protein with RPS1 domain
MKEGDKVPVAVKEVDEKGRLNLSIKAANPEFFTKKEEIPRPPRPAGHGGPSGGRGERRRF